MLAALQLLARLPCCSFPFHRWLRVSQIPVRWEVARDNFAFGTAHRLNKTVGISHQLEKGYNQFVYSAGVEGST